MIGILLWIKKSSTLYQIKLFVSEVSGIKGSDKSFKKGGKNRHT